MSQVIYQKKYPKFDFEKIEKEFANLPKRERELIEKNERPSEEFLRELQDEGYLVPIPYRKKMKKEFIESVIDFSEQFEIAVKITEEKGLIQALFSFDTVGFISGLKKALILADETSFFVDTDNNEIKLMLDFYTHFQFSKSGRLIAPR